MCETTVDQLAAALDQGAPVIDVREPAEFREGHVPGATNIPMGQLTARLGEIDPNRPVHVVCASGNRSSAMADVLTANGRWPQSLDPLRATDREVRRTYD